MNIVVDANTAIYGTRAANGIIFIETTDRNGRAATASARGRHAEHAAHRFPRRRILKPRRRPTKRGV
ncbi:MAG: hypothetical protein ACLSAM_13515 [Alistipes onderdonkii]